MRSADDDERSSPRPPGPRRYLPQGPLTLTVIPRLHYITVSPQPSQLHHRPARRLQPPPPPLQIRAAMIRFDNLPPEVVQAMCTPMHLVLQPTTQPSGAYSGALYIGSLAAVQDPASLRAAHITHLVQVLDAPWLPLSEKDGFDCLRVPIMDERSTDIRPFLEGVCAHIDAALRAGRSVLVHCQQGVSRSSAIVLAYLIRYHGMSYDSAFAYLRRKRACIKPNSGFVRALQEWEASCRRPVVSRRFTS